MAPSHITHTNPISSCLPWFHPPYHLAPQTVCSINPIPQSQRRGRPYPDPTELPRPSSTPGSSCPSTPTWRGLGGPLAVVSHTPWHVCSHALSTLLLLRCGTCGTALCCGGTTPNPSSFRSAAANLASTSPLNLPSGNELKVT